MKLNRKWLLVIALVMSLAMATAGTLAYLTDSDAAANVMTLGSVKIEQHEYERVIENGKYKTTTINDKTSYVLKEFSQDKPLMPATVLDDNGNPYNFGAGDYDTTRVKMSQVDSHGSMDVFESKNAQDKFITVENTGRSDAYVRTLIALEIGELPVGSFDEVIRTSSFMTTQGVWKVTDVGVVKIKGNNYFVSEYVYNGAKHVGGVHENGVLPAGDTTYPSLAQVYMTAAATNEDCEKIDGNLNGKYDILVLSQAVQVNGFDDAETALNAGFGDANVENVAKWFGDSGVVEITLVETLDDLKDVFANGGKATLVEDIKLEKITPVEEGKEVYLDLNGKTITVDQNTASNTLIWVKDGAKLTIDGNGTIDLGDVSTMAIFCPYGELVIENGTFKRNKVTTVTDATTGLFMGAKNSGCNVTINGGYFDPGYYDANAADIEEILAGTKVLTETADDIAKRGKYDDKNLVRTAVKDNVSVVLNHSGYGSFKVYGGTFVGANPAWGDEGCMLPTTPNYLRPWSYYQGPLLAGQTFNENGLVIPDGYTITEGTTTDGRPTYTVTYSK